MLKKNLTVLAIGVLVIIFTSQAFGQRRMRPNRVKPVPPAGASAPGQSTPKGWSLGASNHTPQQSAKQSEFFRPNPAGDGTIEQVAGETPSPNSTNRRVRRSSPNRIANSQRVKTNASNNAAASTPPQVNNENKLGNFEIQQVKNPNQSANSSVSETEVNNSNKNNNATRPRGASSGRTTGRRQHLPKSIILENTMVSGVKSASTQKEQSKTPRNRGKRQHKP